MSVVRASEKERADELGSDGRDARAGKAVRGKRGAERTSAVATRGRPRRRRSGREGRPSCVRREQWRCSLSRRGIKAVFCQLDKRVANPPVAAEMRRIAFRD